MAPSCFAVRSSALGSYKTALRCLVTLAAPVSSGQENAAHPHNVGRGDAV